jgi:hypothetical protein
MIAVRTLLAGCVLCVHTSIIQPKGLLGNTYEKTLDLVGS